MRQIDAKFRIEGERILNPAGEEVPEDEPLFLLRARDRNALAILRLYQVACEIDQCNDYQMDGIHNAIQRFEKFQREHRERMKQPGITRGGEV